MFDLEREIAFAEAALDPNDPRTQHWLNYLLLLEDGREEQAAHYFEDCLLDNEV
jgi:hypothetical protein